MIFFQTYFIGTIFGEGFGAAVGDSVGEIVDAVIIDYVVGERFGAVNDDNVDFVAGDLTSSSTIAPASSPPTTFFTFT